MKELTKGHISLNNNLIMKKGLVFVLLFLSTIFSMAQLPIGQDSLVGTEEMKKIMLENNFNYYKTLKESEINTVDRKYIHILYKEEIRVNFSYNLYNNIESIAFRTSNDDEKIINKIKNITDYHLWEYIYSEKKDIFGVEGKIYKVHDYFVRYYYNPNTDGDVYQIILTKKL